jgi:hypothetical protein
MSVIYKLNREDLFFAMLIMQFHQPFAIIVYLLCLLILSYLNIEIVSNIDTPGSFMTLIVFLIFELIPICIVASLPMVTALMSAFSRKNRRLLDEHGITIGEDLFTTVSESSRSEIQWKALQRVTVTWGYLFLYLSQAGAIIIPRHAFGSEQEWKEFVQFCRSKLAR